MAVMLGSGLASQTGAALGAMAFPVIGPVGVVAVRQWVAAVILLAVGRPRLRAFTRQQWQPVLALAAVFGTMNLSLYSAIDRVGLGLAVTLEFLGPLAVALAGALTARSTRSRRLAVLACPVFAAVGVLVLTRPQPTTDYVGIGLGLLAASCWAGYILLSRTVGRRFTASRARPRRARSPRWPTCRSASRRSSRTRRPRPPSACAAVAGLLSSAVPFLADLFVLRRIPAHFFGIFMSVNPVLAAVVGAVVLGEALAPLDWFAIALIVTANALGVLLTPTAQPGRAVAEPAPL